MSVVAETAVEPIDIDAWISYLESCKEDYVPVEYMTWNGERNKVEDLLSVVASVYGINQDVVLTRTRKQVIKDARFVYMYLLQTYFGCSSKKVQAITGWDHATILHVKKQVTGWIETNAHFRRNIRLIKNIIECSMIRIPGDPRFEKGYFLFYKGKQALHVSSIEEGRKCSV